MPLFYQNLNLAVAQINGPERVEYPFYRFGDSTHIIVTQPYAQLWANYSPLALNVSATLFGATCYMVGDTTPNDIGAATVGFDRQFSNVPSTHYDYESLSVTYPGYFDGPENVRIRQSYTQTVQAQISFEYFLTGSGQTYTTPAAIPMISDTRVTDAEGLNVSILSGVDVNNGDGEFVFATDPTLSDYLDLVSDDASSAASYSLVESCKISQYIGNIWCRETRRLKAR